MMHLSAWGRLGRDPESHTTRTGNEMTSCVLAVDLEARSRDATDNQATEWVSLVAFGKAAEALACHTKGDCVSVSGDAQVNLWTPRDGGDQRRQLQLIVRDIVGARSTRPKGGGRR